MMRVLLSICLLLGLTLPVRADVDIQEFVTPGGIKAWLVEAPEIPTVSIELRFQGGASLDAPGKRGAINLMTGLLEEGAGGLDARGFAKARNALAASYSFDVNNDDLSVSALFLTENQDEAVSLLQLALIQPRFDEDAIERVREQVRSIIRSDAQDPNKLASAAFRAAAFGDHPYGSSLNGTLESLNALTRDDLVDAKARVMARDRLFVSAVGDISQAELSAMLDRLLGDLPASGAPMPERAEYQLQGGVTVIPYDSPQSVAVFGHQGLTRHDPDFFAAYILNEVVGGGGFTSRLMDEVREKRGLTYGVGSYLLPLDHAELLMGQVASANDRVADAMDVIRDEWVKVAENGITEDELATAKTFLTGAYPLRFDGNARIANIMVGMQMQGLGTDYIATRNDKVEAVSIEDIKRVAQRLITPDALHFIVVGQPENLESTN